MFVQEHGSSTLKNRKSHRILNKPSNAAASIFFFPSVGLIAASWKRRLEMFRCEPTQEANITSEHNPPVLIRLKPVCGKSDRLKDDIQAMALFKGQ